MSWLAHFDLDNLNMDAYERWRDEKLKDYPSDTESLIVEIKNPFNLSQSEKQAMMKCIQKTNMVIYSGPTGDDPDPEIARSLGKQFGLHRQDINPGADESGVTALAIQSDSWHKRYIPYTDKQLHWHTDGYYNELDKQIYAIQLHCVQPSKEGGVNALMDQEMAYLLLRERNVDLVRALQDNLTLSIPANMDDSKVQRPDRSGPVFMPNQHGQLHMRYTARARNVVWSDTKSTHEAADTLHYLLQSQSPYIYNVHMQSGQGLICNNVLHNRTSFEGGDATSRLLYRLRYYDRIENS